MVVVVVVVVVVDDDDGRRGGVELINSCATQHQGISEGAEEDEEKVGRICV